MCVCVHLVLGLCCCLLSSFLQRVMVKVDEGRDGDDVGDCLCVGIKGVFVCMCVCACVCVCVHLGLCFSFWSAFHFRERRGGVLFIFFFHYIFP